MSKPRTLHGIPTKHKGRQFRSRLEARWATFFDLVGWRYEYEPFDCNGWIPDFALFGRKGVLLVEVKPDVGICSRDELTEPKIVRADPNHEVLLVGCTLDFWAGVRHHEHFRDYTDTDFGLLLEGPESRAQFPPEARCAMCWHVAKFATWSETLPAPLGLTVSGPIPEDAQFNRLGDGDGETYLHVPAIQATTRRLWTEAGNRTQWKPPVSATND